MSRKSEFLRKRERMEITLPALLVKSWCIPEITPEFLAAMEYLLELYAQPYEKARPLVCFDEKSVELHADVRVPLTIHAGHPKRVD
jgi:hypothetical protein